MPALGRTNDPSLVIPPPRPDRPPLHANLLNTLQKGAVALTPLFPYTHAGAIVPTGTLFIGGPGKDYGQFYHHNSVDEIIVCFVSEGGTLASSQVYVGGRTHGVNSFLKDQTKPGTLALFSITQRQLEQGPQPEAVSLICGKCREPLYRMDYDGGTPPDAREIDHPVAAAFELWVPFREFNANPELRTCKSCGHENSPFPVHNWGWGRFHEQCEAVVAAKQTLLKAAGAASA